MVDKATAAKVQTGSFDSSSLSSFSEDGGDDDDERSGRPRRLRIVDVGCGRAYLTFAALHHFASKAAGSSSSGSSSSSSGGGGGGGSIAGASSRWAVETTGVEIRPDLVDEVTRLAAASSSFVHPCPHRSIGLLVLWL